MGATVVRSLREGALWVFGALALIVLAALITYDRNDPSFATTGEPGPISNVIGPLGAHLSARKRIFSFPVLREATWVAVDTRRLSYLDSIRAERARAPLAKLRRDPRWRLVFSEDGVLVFRRRD